MSVIRVISSSTFLGILSFSIQTYPSHCYRYPKQENDSLGLRSSWVRRRSDTWQCLNQHRLRNIPQFLKMPRTLYEATQRSSSRFFSEQASHGRPLLLGTLPRPGAKGRTMLPQVLAWLISGLDLSMLCFTSLLIIVGGVFT